jgi:hypothetical protein
MRYLFGDSTPFPLPFDFLRTLEAFMVAGTRVILLDHKAQALADEALAARQERAQGLETLAGLHQSVHRSLRERAVPQHPYAIDYATRLTEQAVALFHERRRIVKASDEEDDAHARAERVRVNEEIATHLSAFFKIARLPVTETRLYTALVDGRPDARASTAHPGGIGVAFTLDTAKAPGWSAPRKVGDLGLHAELKVAIKKSFFGGKVTREPLRIDEWVIGSADLDPTSATIALRKKPDQKDTLIFKIRRDGEAIYADVENPGDPNAGILPTFCDPGDLPHLEQLWTAVAATFDAILEQRTSITKLSLDSEDANERGLGRKVVERLVMVLGPTVLELVRRSPNPRELSLKLEGDGGRREELYLKRDELVGMLQPLPHAGRAVFAPLGLDDWVPAVTVRPPAVASAPVSRPVSGAAAVSGSAPVSGPAAPVERVTELLSIDLEEEG